MQIFLAAIPLKGETVVVVGGGEPGLAKLRLFIPTPARVLWFTPEGLPPVESRPAGAPEPIAAVPTDHDLVGAKLVFVGLEDEDEAVAIATRARQAGAQVNVVDKPALSDFQTPALIDRDAVVIGVATGGAAPILARDIRSAIEGVLPAALGPLAELAGGLRDRVRVAIPDGIARRRFWERAFRGLVPDLVAADRMEDARAEMDRLIDADAPEPGVVHLVGVGPGDPELLTLKTLRLLQNADLLIHDVTIPEAILVRARRDAKRVCLQSGGSEADVVALLVEGARGGQRVARLHRGDARNAILAQAEMASLQAEGVAVFLVPGVA